MKKSLIFATLAVLLATSFAVGSVLACTTLTPGYWKTHGVDRPRKMDWPLEGTVIVGAISYDLTVVADHLALLDTMPTTFLKDFWMVDGLFLLLIRYCSLGGIDLSI